MHKLTNINLKYEWNQSYQVAFDNLKEVLVKALILAFPDFNSTFTLFTDVSDIAIGYILTQYNENNNEYMILYVSKVLNAVQTRYSITKRECLAVVEFIK